MRPTDWLFLHILCRPCMGNTYRIDMIQGDTHSQHCTCLPRRRLVRRRNCLGNLQVRPHLVEFLLHLLKFFAEKVVGRALGLVQLSSNKCILAEMQTHTPTFLTLCRDKYDEPDSLKKHTIHCALPPPCYWCWCCNTVVLGMSFTKGRQQQSWQKVMAAYY